MKQRRNFEVRRYSIGALKRLLASVSGATPDVVDKKLHTVYLEEYFAKIGARTVVVEHDYVDRDFLEDFAGYYVRCFRRYKSRCARLHFFSFAFTNDQFENLLTLDPGTVTGKRLADAYLGFIVVKPLPRTIIGRTCLKT